MQCIELNTKTTAKQVWLYFIFRTKWLGYTGNTLNLQIVLIIPKNPNLNPRVNQATQKKYLPNFPSQKNPIIENFKPKKSFNHPHHLESGVLPALDTLH